MAIDLYRQAPGCTIGLQAGEKDPLADSGRQDPRHAPNGAHGARFLAADHDRKKVSVGVLSLQGETGDLFALSRAASPLRGTAPSEGAETVHRFWFYPRFPDAPRFLRPGRAAWISRPVSVQLLLGTAVRRLGVRTCPRST
jgi:hypothetical protein